MKRWWNNFLWKYEDAMIFTIAITTGIVIFIGSIVSAIGFLMGQQDQYSCNLKHRPAIKIELLINHETYAYDPKGFCNQLKEKMAK